VDAPGGTRASKISLKVSVFILNNCSSRLSDLHKAMDIFMKKTKRVAAFEYWHPFRYKSKSEQSLLKSKKVTF
jgi:hypothetical protein